jgi:hypothetical protein
VRLLHFPEGVGGELNLFGDWYAVSLTSPPELAEGHLRQWTAGAEGPKWIITDMLVPIDIPKAANKSEAAQSKTELPYEAPNPLRWLKRFWNKANQRLK